MAFKAWRFGSCFQVIRCSFTQKPIGTARSWVIHFVQLGVWELSALQPTSFNIMEKYIELVGVFFRQISWAKFYSGINSSQNRFILLYFGKDKQMHICCWATCPSANHSFADQVYSRENLSVYSLHETGYFIGLTSSGSFYAKNYLSARALVFRWCALWAVRVFFISCSLNVQCNLANVLMLIS